MAGTATLDEGGVARRLRDGGVGLFSKAVAGGGGEVGAPDTLDDGGVC